MKLRNNIKHVIIELICFLFVLLFVYAAISKLIDFENFQVQLGQSPLLSAFASWVSYLVPLVELLVVVLLVVNRWRFAGLLAALMLMVMFSSYIFIVLHYTSFVPCSCGGILEKMSWNQHLIFNLFFVFLALIALLIYTNLNQAKNAVIKGSSIAEIIGISMLSSISFMIILFLTSEEIMHHENPFIRRYPQHPALLTHQMDLKFNSYYFAGYRKGKIYLGNYTNPLQLLSVDASLKNKQFDKISFAAKNRFFQRVTIGIRDTFFYLKDGMVATVFTGSTSDWKLSKELKGMPFFTQAEAMDSTAIVFRANNGKDFANVLGLFRSNQKPKVAYNLDLLQQQIDGVFDTDGILLYSEEIKKIVYLYFYRNEFIVADANSKLAYRGHTIDTTTKAKIKVGYLKNKTERTMIAPPLVVNANAAVCQNLLFVHSKIKGRYENDTLWEQAAIIDVYDLNKNAYLLSFPIYNNGEKKLNSLWVTTTHLYAIVGNELMVYELRTILKKEINSVGHKES
jgi:hypothetical protein